MRPALLLIDAQHDFLATPSLQPGRVELCASLEGLLRECRHAGIPVVHVWTTVDDHRSPMPHWHEGRARRFHVGAQGHATPTALRPVAGEEVFPKQFFSAFGDDSLEKHLRACGVDTVILAGLYLRACIRTTAIDAYQRGFAVWIAADAIGDDDPLHGAVSRQYLASRFAWFPTHAEVCAILHRHGRTDGEPTAVSMATLPTTRLHAHATPFQSVAGVEHFAPHDGRPLFHVSLGRREHVAAAAESAEQESRMWRHVSLSERIGVLTVAAERLAEESEGWARRIVLDTGKPLLEARREVSFARNLIRSTIRLAAAERDAQDQPDWRVQRRPHGVVALITPWNNPLAIPLGKIAPALLYGNTVVWKPAIPASEIAVALYGLLQKAGLPEGVVNIVLGDHHTAEFALDHPLVQAASLTGSSTAGYAAQAICARRRIPFQGELGGNNAAIVWSDTDLRTAAQEIAVGGFGSAGQRCTANRRVIVERRIYEEFTAELRAVTDSLPWGDPFDETTVVGPLISHRACQRVTEAVAAAQADGAVILTRRDRSEGPGTNGSYFPPTVVCGVASTSEIVQEEIFGPVVVVQSAWDWPEAIRLCNGVRQGLAASLFSQSTSLQKQFLDEGQAGVLKLNQSTAGADDDVPFGGWKSSGIGPPEHGIADREFYTRLQTVYRSPDSGRTFWPNADPKSGEMTP